MPVPFYLMRSRLAIHNCYFEQTDQVAELIETIFFAWKAERYFENSMRNGFSRQVQKPLTRV